MRVVAPSSPFPEERLARGVERLTAAGFVVDDTSGLLVGEHAYLNGSDDERKRALEDALAARDVDVLWLARGGYGLTRILSSLEVPRDELPVVVGFSDATALHALLWQRGFKSVHGPLATTIAGEPDESFRHLVRVVAGEASGGALGPLRALHGDDGVVEGRLFAANLCVLTHLAGTRAQPNLEGALLVLEEIGERPYRIDRMLTQLMEAGALEGVRAVVVGHLSGCEEPSGGVRPAPTAAEVFRERVAALGVPLVAGLACGHVAPNFALPVGARARLAIDGASASLTLVEDVTGPRGGR